jgi:hypothetical protein
VTPWPWSQIFLGVIAVATLTTAIVQVGVLIVAARLTRRAVQLTEKIEREIGPAFDHLNKIARDASRAVALATAQVERADRLFTDLSKRVEETVSGFQATVAGPARSGMALFSAFRAALDVIRDARRRARSRHGDDEDALFI